MKTAYTREEHLTWLDATIELFSDPDRWTDKYWAMVWIEEDKGSTESFNWEGLNSYDHKFVALFPRATCYCIEGGLYKTALDLGYVTISDPIYSVLRSSEMRGILVDLIKDTGFSLGGPGYGDSLNAYNDTLGYEAVVELLKKARAYVASMETERE